MSILGQGKFRALLRAGFSYLLISLFLIIISVQNLSVTQTVHADSKAVCSCGCQDDGGSCAGSCCGAQSLSQCNCSEPHETIVYFVIPASLDSFIESKQHQENTQLFSKGVGKYENNFYDSFVSETPAPVPIV